MGGLWLILLLSWAGGHLCCASTASFIASPQECKKASFVPGYNLGGEGFDIVKMERKGSYVIDSESWLFPNNSCKMFKNSYMNEDQKVPVAVVNWRPLPRCRIKVSTTLYDSVESLVKESTSTVNNNWKTGLTLPAVGVSVSLGGSHSKSSLFGMKKSKTDRYTFARHEVHCSYYRYRMKENPPMSKEFLSAVNALPIYTVNNEQYLNLIDTYGTHYITQVSLGGEIKAITSFKTCEATLSGLKESDVSNCLEVEASVTTGKVAANAMAKHCKNLKRKIGHEQSFSSLFSERYEEFIGGEGNPTLLGSQNSESFKEWKASLKTIPDVVKYSLKPLHLILPNDHRAKYGLKKEVEKYIVKNILQKKCSETCQIGHKSNARDSCACVCNSNQNVAQNCCPVKRGLATLEVFNLKAHNLYGDVTTKTDGSVSVKYGDQEKRTRIIKNNDNPQWPERFEFGPIQINMANRLTFTVYDADRYWNSDKLGECSFALREGLVRRSCSFDYGTFFFTYKVACAPSLGGSQCENYISSPLDVSLANTFYTRNGVLLGESSKKND